MSALPHLCARRMSWRSWPRSWGCRWRATGLEAHGTYEEAETLFIVERG